MIKTWRPVSPPRCNYTTPQYRPTSPVTEIRIWSNARSSQESTSWLGDKRGVTAGGDPSGSRRSISIQNHAYDFSKRRHTLSVSSSWKMPPNRQRTGVIFFFDFFFVGGGWISWRKNEALTWASGLQPVAQTHTGFLCGKRVGNPMKINCSSWKFSCSVATSCIHRAVCH